MWHVRFVEVYGSLVFEHEYVSGYVGSGSVRHATDKHLKVLCGADQRKRKLHVRFDLKREPITCQRCLMFINASRNLLDVTNWQEE